MKLETLLKLHSVRLSGILGIVITVVGVLQQSHVAVPSWLVIGTGIATALGVPAARNIMQPDVTGNT